MVAPETATRQQGVALLVVLILMAALLTLGVMGLQAALVAERLAGNYHAANLARMRADSAATHALEAYTTLDWSGAPSLSDDALVDWRAFVDRPKAVRLCPSKSCLYLPVVRDGERWVMALGAVLAEHAPGQVVAQSPPRFVRASEQASDDADHAGEGGATEATLVWQ